MSENILHAKTLERSQYLNLKGNWKIVGDIPNGATIELTGGNLAVDGNLGLSVTLKNTTGAISFHNAGFLCNINASRGPVSFNKAGYDSKIRGTSITCKSVERKVSLHATKGDIAFTSGGDELEIHSKNNTTFEKIGAGCDINVEGTLTYGSMGEDCRVIAGKEVCTSKTKPNTKGTNTALEGRVGSKEICLGLEYDKKTNIYTLELLNGKHIKQGVKDEMAALYSTVNSHSGVVISDYKGPHNKNRICRFQIPARNKEIKQAVDDYIKAVKELEPAKVKD